MFKINYRIVESYDRLREMDTTTYDKEWGNIEGLIKLQFGESSIGYMYQDEITPEMYEAGCFQDELLVSWFANLLDTVVALHQSDYVTLSEIECPNVIEFCKKGNQLRVRELREVFKENKELSDIVSKGSPIISLEKLKYTIQLKSGKHIEEEVKLRATDFKEVIILQSEYEQEVLVKAVQFVDEIASQFPWLIPSKTFVRLNEQIENVRLLVKK